MFLTTTPLLDWLSKLFLPTDAPDVTQSLITILLAIALGVFFGRLRIGKVSLGVSAVMFVGLVLGHYGYRIQDEILHFIRDFGLILFVYGIGIQVGPSFFSSFKNEGLKLNILAVSTVLFGGAITFILYKTTNLNIENLVGLMSGSVTNTPGLGAAKSTLLEIQNQFPEKKFSDPTIAYAITYPMGVLGVILTIIISKILLKINPKDELRKFRFSKVKTEVVLIQEKCRVTQTDVIGKTINQAIKLFGKEIVVTKLKHSGSDAVFSPTLDTRLQEKDVLMIEGSKKDVKDFIDLLGRKSTDSFIESEKEIQIKNLFVTNPKVMHKKLFE